MARPRPPQAGLPLPTRDGVGPSCIALPPGPWPTILDFLAQRLPAVSAQEWADRSAAGEVVDEYGLPVTTRRAHAPGIRIYYYRSLPHESSIPFKARVLFQDDYLLVADKPHFLPVTPSGRYVQETLLVRLKRETGIDTLSPIHRIDRETAGLVVFAIRPETRGRYQALFEQKVVTKHYEAIAPLHPAFALPRSAPMLHRSRLVEDETDFMQMREVPGEANSETRIELIETLPALPGSTSLLARYRLTPITGRKHQLRAHCAALGMPILHDLIYPTLFAVGSDDYDRPLQLLAREIAFRDPITGDERRFCSERTLMDAT